MDAASEQVKTLSGKVKKATVPSDLQEKILVRLDQLSRLTNSPTFLPEFDRINRYIEWVVSIPWGKRTKDILDLDHAKKILDKNHHGLVEIKDRVLEYISVMKLKQEGEKGIKPGKGRILLWSSQPCLCVRPFFVSWGW